MSILYMHYGIWHCSHSQSFCGPRCPAAKPRASSSGRYAGESPPLVGAGSTVPAPCYQKQSGAGQQPDHSSGPTGLATQWDISAQIKRNHYFLFFCRWMCRNDLQQKKSRIIIDSKLKFALRPTFRSCTMSIEQ